MKNKSNSNYVLIAIVTLLITIIGVVLLWCSPKLDGVGSYLSGVGTFGLLLLAILQLPKEFEKNRLQRHEDKLFDVTYELMETVEKLRRLAFVINYGNGLGEEGVLDSRDSTSKHSRAKFRARSIINRFNEHYLEIDNIQGQIWKTCFLRHKQDEIKAKIQKFLNILYELRDDSLELINLQEDATPEDANLILRKLNSTINNDLINKFKAEVTELLKANINI